MKTDDDYADLRAWFEDTVLPREGTLRGVQLPCVMLTMAANGASMVARLTQAAPRQRITLEVLSAHDVDDGLPLPLTMVYPSETGIGVSLITTWEPTSTTDWKLTRTEPGTDTK